MDRLCKFSTSILAGNVATLVLVAMVTDYWQHRGFDAGQLRQRLDAARVETRRDRRPSWDGGSDGPMAAPHGADANRTDLTWPADTQSYAVLGYRHDAFRGYSYASSAADNNNDTKSPAELQMGQLKVETALESPALLQRAWYLTSSTAGAAAAGASKMTPAFDLAYMYTEYGSLMRDCKQLETLSIERLPLPSENKVRCEWFLFGRAPDHFITLHLPAVQYLEIFSAAFALAALTCTLASLTNGVRGNLQRDSVALTRASALAVATSTCCTLTIALFHAKLNLRSRRQIFADQQPQHMELIFWLREVETVTFGWSFYLAWLCVVLSMAEAGMWLHQMDRRERDAEWEKNRDLVERIRAYYRNRNFDHRESVYED